MPEFDDDGVKGGVWRGRLRADSTEPPLVTLVLLGETLAEARLSPDAEGVWLLEADLPPDAVSDGVQTLLLTAAGHDGTEAVVLGRLPLLVGRPLDRDLTTEIGDLRAELELVKRELRRLASSLRAG